MSVNLVMIGKPQDGIRGELGAVDKITSTSRQRCSRKSTLCVGGA